MSMSTSTSITLHGIPNCDTVRRARGWLAERGVVARFHDFRRDGTDAAWLQAACDTLGWQALVNTRGTTWRGLDEATRAAVVDSASACALMQAHPGLIRRPIVQWSDGALTVGFDPDDWARRTG